jgi:hypothetical protein
MQVTGGDITLAANLAPASTTVTAGAQTIDVRFSMSTVGTVTDSWKIDGVTIERLA